MIINIQHLKQQTKGEIFFLPYWADTSKRLKAKDEETREISWLSMAAGNRDDAN